MSTLVDKSSNISTQNSTVVNESLLILIKVPIIPNSKIDMNILSSKKNKLSEIDISASNLFLSQV